MGSGGSKGDTKTSSKGSPQNTNVTNTNTQKQKQQQQQQQQRNGSVTQKSEVKNQPNNVKPATTAAANDNDIEDVRRRASEGKLLLRQRTLFQHARDANTHLDNDGIIHPIFRGDISANAQSTSKIVRIFTSSTFTDTGSERNILMDKAYPKIKSYCQDRGYEFQVVDMRWGVRDESTDDHMVNEICLREVKLCKELSTGPNFVLLLSHKYGSRALLREIEADDFEKIYQAITSETDKKLINKWFKRDDNAVPPVYVLQPISKYIPDFLSDDNDKKQTAKDLWNEENSQMKEIFANIAEEKLEPDKSWKYTVSITEWEAQLGMLQCFDAHKACVWFKRTISDIGKQKPDKLLSRYIECTGPEDQQQKARELHRKLTEEKIPGVLPAKQIHNYSVNWSSKGIDPDNKDHKKYLEQLANDFIKKMCKMVDDGIKERSMSEVSDPLYEECYLHSSFCKNKCLDFQGREETLKKIESYIIGKSCFPLVIHGVSGCGKTSIVAKAAYLSWQWMKERAAIILRFVGTTPDSSNINDFLASVTLQIKKNYGEDSSIPEDLKELIQEFQTSLSLARWNHPLVLVIDSLDQFDPANGARMLSWLPATLPPHVRLIVSTLEDEEYESFQKLKSMKVPKDNFIAVPKLPDQDVSNIVDHWLAKRKRTLTPSQRQVLSKSFEKCPLPIYLKLSFDEACRWTSYSDKSTTVLQTTVRNSINTLFSRLEVKHGETFVSRALGYLTEARSGLSTSELEDVLACDDEALQNVYTRRPPPIRRLPPLYLVRLKSDLQQYLVERGADGIRVLFWYHRQFIEAANDRYCGPKIVGKLNAGLAEFFSGTWANGKPKPYTDGSGVENSADRHVASQPLQFGNSYNIRKINNLPHHRTLAGHLDLLKKECLCNFEFILAKLLTSSIRQVIEDYALAKKKFPEDKEISLITDALQLSQSALIYDPLQLAPQMLDRMAGEQVMLPFLKQCEAFSIPFLKPSTEVLIKPGGQLVYCLAGHTEPVRALDMKKNGREVVTCSEDDTIKTWDIIEGHMIKSYDGLGIDPDNVLFIMNDKLIMAHYQQRIKGIRQAGDIVYTIEVSGTGAAYGVGGKNKSVIAVFENQMAKLYDGETGNHLTTVEHPDTNVQFQDEGCVAGSEHYMVIRSKDVKKFSVLNLANRSFSYFSEAFPADPKAGQPDIEGLVISMNEKFILCTNNMSSNIFIFDINSLKKDDELKGHRKNFSQNLHLTYSGNFLYCPSNKCISVKNMKTGSVELVLEHPADVDDVVSVDAQRFVTRSDDVVIRVWDLSRKEKEAGVSDLSHNDSVTKMEPLPNCRYVVCLSRAVNKSTGDVAVYLQVYDLGENVIVRQAEVIDSDARILKVLNNNEIIIATLSRRLKVINLDSMKVISVFQGKVHKALPDILVLKDGKEVVVTTRGQLGLKIYDTNTGKVKAIIKTPNSEEIEEIKGSNDGSVLLARTSDGPYLLYDLKKGQLIKSLVEDDFGFMEFLSTESMISSSMISSNGNYIGISGTKSIPIPTLEGEKSDENMMCIWDVKAGKKIQDLYDEEYHTKYETKDNRKGLSIGVDEAVNLGDSLILTAHDDFIVRVWDIKSGKLIKRLFGHTTNVELRVNDKSPYILTYGCWEEENALRLWDKVSYECIATYKLDKQLSKNAWCTDGTSFISTMKDPAKMIHWKLHGTTALSNTSQCPVIYKDKKCDLEIEFEHEDDNSEDPNDPDQDPDYDD